MSKRCPSATKIPCGVDADATLRGLRRCFAGAHDALPIYAKVGSPRVCAPATLCRGGVPTASTTPRATDHVRARHAAAYDAFVSYSHAADGRLAPALQEGLQSLGKAWYRRRALRVFRDKTSLTAAPELWPSIERHLAECRAFILLASPEAALSPGWNRRSHGGEHTGTGTAS